MSDSKILIIGLDGGTWRVLDTAIKQGFMPHLEKLRQEGASGILQSTIPPKTPAAWSSFQTGCNPGQNGIFDFSYWDRKEKTARFINAQHLTQTMWEIAGHAGKHVGVINVPLTYPPRKINGIMITGILTPSLDSEFTWPADFKAELLQAAPDYHIFNLGNITRDFSGQQFESFIKQMNTITDSRARAAEYILTQKGPFDLFMVHFQATDVLQHALWSSLDQKHPNYEPKKHQYILEHFFQPLDEKIGRLWRTFQATVKGDHVLFIASDHGFQHHLKRFNLGNWLVQRDFLCLSPLKHKDRIAAFLRNGLSVLHLKKTAARGKLGRPLQHISRTPSVKFDWDNSRVFSFSRGNDGFVYLLEKDEYARQKAETQLREQLSQIIDPETDTLVVTNILTRDEIYHGAKIDQMPDLILKPADGYSFTGDYSPQYQGLFHQVNPRDDFHVGMHHRDGIFLAFGKAIRTNSTIDGASILDIAPTILTALKIAVPESIDGKVLQDIFQSPIEIQYINSTESPSVNSAPQEFNESEQKQIEDRLRGLGYLE